MEKNRRRSSVTVGESSSVSVLTQRYFRQTAELFGNQLYLDSVPDLSHQGDALSLNDFQEHICQCVKCPLGHTRTKFVFGVGDPHADLVFVGEAPGRDEDFQGEPFVGRAGQLLDKILAAIKLSRNEVYICNILKCRPPDNRTPHKDEIESCMPYLEEQLNIIKPKLIVALGTTAAHAFLKVKTPLGKLRSQKWKWKNFDLVVTYHPAALLRNPAFKRPAWEDFQWVNKLMAET